MKLKKSHEQNKTKPTKQDNSTPMNFSKQEMKDVEFLEEHIPTEFKKNKTLMEAFINGFTPSASFRKRLKGFFYPKWGSSAAASARAFNAEPSQAVRDRAYDLASKLPTGRGGTEPLFKLQIKLGEPKKKATKVSDEARDRKNIESTKSRKLRTTGSDEARDRKNIDSATKPKTTPTGRGGTESLMPKEYKIKRGDTLSAIAKRHNTTVAMLKAANNIKDADDIKAGATIKLYKGKAKPQIKAALPPSLKGKPRTISAAKKAKSLYFWDAKGDKKIAVTDQELKKSGLTLSQWINKNKKSIGGIMQSEIAKSRSGHTDMRKGGMFNVKRRG